MANTSLLAVQTNIGVSSLVGCGTATPNGCATGGDFIPDYGLRAFEGYDHGAKPPTPTGLDTTPGNSAFQTSNPTQDSHIYIDWFANPSPCTTKYDLWRSDTQAGSYTRILIGTTNTFYSNNIGSSSTSRWYKVGANNATIDGDLSSAVQGSTTPEVPQSVNGNDDYDCFGPPFQDWVITISWSNGGAGVRKSVVSWQVQINGGGYGSTFTTAGSATSFDYDAGIGGPGDTFGFRLWYSEESAKTTRNYTVLCPE